MKIKHLSWVFVLALLLFSETVLFAQVNKDGLPVIKTYSTAVTGGAEWNYTILKDDRGVLYFGNEGVLEFDGVKWTKIAVKDNPSILAMEKDPEGTVFVGGPYQFGYLEPDDVGSIKYVSLSERLDSLTKLKIGDVWNIKYFKENLYFVCKSLIFRYNKVNDLLDTLITSDDFITPQEVYVINDELLISDNREGLTRLVGDSLSLLPGGDFIGMDYCMAVLPYDSTLLLVGGFYKGLFLYNPKTGKVRSDFVSESLNEELRIKHIYTSLLLPDGNFAFGTTSGGVYILNREGELIMLLSNSTTEMEDDQTYHIYVDDISGPSSQLWISTVGFLNKVGYNLPYTVLGKALNNINYSITDIREFNGTTYLAGDKGVLKLTFADNRAVFSEIEGIDDGITSLTNIREDNNEYLLAGGIQGLWIIDENDRVSAFADIMANPEAEYNPDFIRKMISSEYHNGRIYSGYASRLKIFDLKNGKWYYTGSVGPVGIRGKVNSIAEESVDRLWISTVDQSKLYTLIINESDTVITEYSGSELDGIIVNNVKIIDNEVYISTDSGIFKYYKESSRFELAETLMLEGKEDINYYSIVPVEGIGYFISAEDYQNFDYLVKPDGTRIIDPFYNISKSYTSAVLQKENKLWISKFQEIYVVDLDRVGDYYEDNNVLIRNVRITHDSLLFGGAFFELNEHGDRVVQKDQPESMIPEIHHSYNDISFTWASTNLVATDSTNYSFMIENFDDEWSRWDKVYYKDYTNLPHGKYKFKVRSRGVNRQISKVAVYEFEIKRAWYQSLLAMFLYFALIILAVFGIIKVYTRRLIRENLRLEGIVADRTKEVVRQKEELEASIHYASRIQRAILPTEKSLKDKVNDYFILFRPRDIVSGDFYWVSERGSRLYIVAADCTGHGVPGAFMSILGVSFLDEIINKADQAKTDVILNQLRTHVTDSLKQMEGGDEETKDGMDLGILVINYKDEEIEFSGAYNPLWLVRELTKEEQALHVKGKLIVKRGSLTNGKHILSTIDADRMPIGVSSRMGDSFTMHRKDLEKGVSYYLFSDGYSDQFGGERGKKFLKKNLKKLILDIQAVPMKQQRDLLEKRLVDWMGSQEQVDDILIMGIKAL